MTVRVRGIYATALTVLLRDAGRTVVQASPPIRRRFDAEFPDDPADAAVTTAADRQGVGVAGDPAAVEAVADAVEAAGLDTFRWAAAAPRGAVVDGTVEATNSGGAVVDLGDGATGFLPFSKADGRIETDDAVRVQVHEPAAPWTDDDPVLGTTVRTFGTIACLERGTDRTVVDSPEESTRQELARTTDLLDAAVPDGWGVRWNRPAADASIDAMDAALAAAADGAGRVEAALADAPSADPPRTVATPEAGAWLWFGRETRAALDERRAARATTMAGHHRVKAGSAAASDAVDFAESVVDDGALPAVGDDGAFPFDAVTRQFGPREGDRVAIGHGKPDGRRVVLGRGEVVDRDPAGVVTVRRAMTGGGTYDALGVEREAGDEAVTRFREGRWWYPTVYRGEDGERKGTYVNVCTPVEVFPREVRYVDLEVDVVRHGDGRVERVDDDDLDAAVEAGSVTEALAEKARSVAASVVSALSD